MSLVSGTPLGVVMPEAVWSVLLVSDSGNTPVPPAFVFFSDPFSKWTWSKSPIHEKLKSRKTFLAEGVRRLIAQTVDRVNANGYLTHARVHTLLGVHAFLGGVLR